MKHMTLEEWDRRVAPFLTTIGIRAQHIRNDAQQITDWVRLLPVAPDFPTEAIEKLKEAREELVRAVDVLGMALNEYDQKEKVS